MVTTTRQPYAYVADNPLNGTDPAGLCSGFDFGCYAGQAAGAVGHAAQSAVQWATTPVDSLNYGKFLAAGVNIGYGLSGVVSGVVAVGAGVLSLGIPFAGEITGPAAIAGGLVRCGSGGARVARGVRQAFEVSAQPYVHERPIDQGVDFLKKAVIPFGESERWDDIVGSLPF